MQSWKWQFAWRCSTAKHHKVIHAVFVSSSDIFHCLLYLINWINPHCWSTPWSRFVNTFGLGFMMTEALPSQISVSHKKSRSFSKKNMKRKDGELCEHWCTSFCVVSSLTPWWFTKTFLCCLSFLWLQVCPPRAGQSDCLCPGFRLWFLCKQYKQHPRGAAS